MEYNYLDEVGIPREFQSFFFKILWGFGVSIFLCLLFYAFFL